MKYSKGHILELEVRDLSHEGEGVGRAKDGFVFFVSGALPGERIRAKVVEVGHRHGRAELVSVEKTSSSRQEAPCSIAHLCGGCALQAFDYKAQLKWKKKRLEEALIRIGGLKNPLIRPVVGMTNPFGYRNKAQYPIARGADGKATMGFYRRRSHQVIPAEDCLIQHPLIVEAAEKACSLINELGLSIYDERTGTGFARHFVVRVSVAREEIMAILVTNGHDFPQAKDWVAGLREGLPQLVSVVQNVNQRVGNRIMGSTSRVLWGAETIVEQLGDYSFEISPGSFFQVNTIQTEVLYELVAQYAGLSKGSKVWDVYCGAGTIGLYLSTDAGYIRGVERDQSAVFDARRNAKRNGIDYASFEVGTAEEVLPRWVREGGRADVCVLDPPRKGCDPDALKSAAAAAPERIVYVSCNPATLARDAAILSQEGYTFVEATPVDMFPQTPHVEAVSLFVRKGV